MSEGGRKVWNREQLLALNDGAIVWVQFDQKPAAKRLGFPQHFHTAQKVTITEGVAGFYLFGQDLGYHMDQLAEEYPIEVIWEPTA